MITGLGGLMSQAERAARKRGHRLTTAHLLMAMFQQRSTGGLLARGGLDETTLLAHLKREPEEALNAAGLASERAHKLARALGDGPVTPLHLLLAIAREPRCAGYRCLEQSGVKLTALQTAALEALHGAGSSRMVSDAPGGVARSRTRRAAVGARRRAGLGLDVVQRALAEETERRTREARRTAAEAPPPVVVQSPPEAATEVGPGPVAEQGVEHAFAPAVAEPEASIDALLLEPPEAAACAEDYALDPDAFPILSSLGRNLSEEAAYGRIDPVLRRDDEIEQLMDILARRRSNCPVLVGAAGVGKTAIVEGMALGWVRDDEEAESGPSRIVIEVSPGALVSGTGVRGALSERLKALRGELSALDGRVVLFVDEIHGVLGGDEGADSLASELKTALSRGELPCVGATTDAEYRRIFERDAALSRRFTRVDVSEPDPDSALQIVCGVAHEYEKHHAVAYQPEALSAAVEMSVRYIAERRLPDKALSLIDQAAARIRRRGGRVVDVEAVARVVSEQAGVPVERLLMRDGECLLALEQHLAARVIGQGEAVAAIASALRKSAAGFRGNRPLGSFLFLGPTGVGKTEMAKAIGELLFPGGELTRFDMSELSEPHTVARLFGAPPGYVGHDAGGQLTEAVRLRPYQAILLDEIEKAHPEVLLSLLPLLDEGRLTDGLGRTVDFKNTVVVMTSNLGARAAAGRTPIGFGREAGTGRDRARDAALAAVRGALPPELFNRIDEPLYFHALGRREVRAIARLLVSRVGEVVEREHGASLSVDDSAIQALIDAGGFDPELGARPMRRVVGRLLEAKLAELSLGGGIARGSRLAVTGRDASLSIAVEPAVDAAE